MTSENYETLKAFLGLTQDSYRWEMTPSERLTIVGMLALLRPRTALELGHRYGGCTRWMSAYCGLVHSVDIDPFVIESCKRFPNVTPWHMPSSEALARLAAEKQKFDFALVDADHSCDAAYADLKATMTLARVIIMHDASNPTARAGYLKALEHADVYHDLDLVDGHLQVDGLWGGLGLVVTDLPKTAHSSVTARLTSNFELQREALPRLAESGPPSNGGKKRNPASLFSRVTERLFR
jgi:hypothetical protein